MPSTLDLPPGSSSSPTATTPPANLGPLPTAAFAGSRRLAALLYSPADHRFSTPTIDKSIYVLRGWSILGLTFPGGHVDAPTKVYQCAINWMVTQPAWRK